MLQLVKSCEYSVYKKKTIIAFRNFSNSCVIVVNFGNLFSKQLHIANVLISKAAISKCFIQVPSLVLATLLKMNFFIFTLQCCEVDFKNTFFQNNFRWIISWTSLYYFVFVKQLKLHIIKKVKYNNLEIQTFQWKDIFT